MACRRCGCRMVTKVGRTSPMLICTDCGLPVDQRESTALKQKRLRTAISLLVMAGLGAALSLLASMNEMRRAGRLESGVERETEAGSKEGDNKKRVLLEPSGLVDLEAPVPDRSTSPKAGPLGKPPAGKGQEATLSAKPGAIEAQQNKHP